MDTSPLAHNLRRLRDARKLTQATLAESAELSRVAYGAIESGDAVPRVDTLLRLAAALGVKLEELVAPVHVLQAVRFRALKRMTSREQILLDVGRWLANYDDLEKITKDRVPYVFAKLHRSVTARPRGASRARAAATYARAELDLAPGERIRDICGLVEERAGIKVGPVSYASDGFFGLSVGAKNGGPAIIVNAWDRISVERWIFTAAHELGHLLLHHASYDVTETDQPDREEKEADQFASEFLMPDTVFRSEWDEAAGLDLVGRVMKVKRMFNVSYRTVLYRLSEREPYGPGIWAKFQAAFRDKTGQTLLRTDEPDALGASEFSPAMVESHAAAEPQRLTADDFVEDRMRRLVRRAFQSNAITVGRAAEILELDLLAMRKLIASWVD
ncbi:MAG TPA: XRE family transcriptional regulator [Myxococcota bacterium]|jgi:Zn-dependent peptidase ImmA (M78 family)/DNA-binding XRE family transcriptional regulator|nr:XRE family transcriptional regulator [Myxococcota bacterium]